MDEQARKALLTRLSDAMNREFQLLLRVRTHANHIEETRKTLGNPFFYSGRPEGDPESKSRYTGYASHEPGSELVRKWQEIAREIESIEGELRAHGL